MSDQLGLVWTNASRSVEPTVIDRVHFERDYNTMAPYINRDDRCIVCGYYAYEEDGTKCYSGFLFEAEITGPTPDRFTIVSPHGTKFERKRFRCTEKNLLRLANLPGVSASCKRLAWEILVKYLYVPMDIAAKAQVLRAMLEAKAGTAARSPVTRSVSYVSEVREPTAQEKAGAMFGRPIPSVEARTTVKQQVDVVPFDEVECFRKHTRYTLFSQQLIGAWAILNARYYPLWFDMRVGKTLTAIVAYLEARERGLADMLIVVCPKINIYAPWADDLPMHNLRPLIIDGSQVDDYDALMEGDYDAIIINYERLGSRASFIRSALEGKKIFLVEDESSAIKEMSASRTKAAINFALDVAFCVPLNGTPAEQGADSLYGQYRTVDPYGIRIGWVFADFAHKYLEREGQKWIIRQDGVSNVELENFIMTSSLRVVRSEADQFAGKDKQNRYVMMKPTTAMKKQAANIAKGFQKLLVNGLEVEGKVKDMVLVIYGHLRELACGYDKFEIAPGVYKRLRHDYDPKLLWVQCFLTAHPDSSLICYTEFNEQEQRLKEMLDEMGITWASTKPRATVKTIPMLKEYLPIEYLGELIQAFGYIDVEYMGDMFITPPALRCFDPKQITFSDAMVEQVEVYVDGKYSDVEIADQRKEFNRGDRQIYIMKTVQARGMALHRKEAVKRGVGTYPSIVYLAQPWSLGSYGQSQDRAVVVDDESGRSHCTMIYNLVMPGIEKRINDALRRKQSVQEQLLHDAEREGYESFVTTLAEEMSQEGAEGEDVDVFDVAEMHSRILCGVPPLGELKKQRVYKCFKDKVGKEYSTSGDFDQELHDAVKLLISRCKQ